MITEKVLQDFSNWDSEKQLSEYQKYKQMGDYSPFSESEYAIMEMVMNNDTISVECYNGVCKIISNTIINEGSLLSEEELLLESKTPNQEAYTKFEILISLLFDTNSKYENVDYLNIDEKVINSINGLAKGTSTEIENNGETIDLIFDKKSLTNDIFNPRSGTAKNLTAKIKASFPDDQNIKFDKSIISTKFISELGSGNIINIKDLLEYPIFHILLHSCNGTPYKEMLDTVYNDNKDTQNMIYNKMKKVERVYKMVATQMNLLFKRIEHSDIAQEMSIQKQKIKSLEADLETEKKRLTDNLETLNAEISELENEKGELTDLEKQELEKLKSTLDANVIKFGHINSELILLKSANEGSDSIETKMYQDLVNSKKDDVEKKIKNRKIKAEVESELDRDLKKFNTKIKANKDIETDLDTLKKHFAGKSIEDSMVELNALLKVNYTISGTERKNEISTERINVIGLKLSPHTIKLLQDSYDSEGKGYGKGELFFVYTMDSETQGGGESFDVSITAGNYEVKSYDLNDDGKMISNGVRLGSYGNMNNFDEFNQLTVLLKLLQDIFGKDYCILNNMLKSATSQNFSDLLESKSKTGNQLIDILKSGEITPINIEELNDALNLSKKAIANAMTAIEANDYKIIELFGAGISVVKYIMDQPSMPMPNENMELTIKVKELKDEEKFNFISGIRKLRTLKAWTEKHFVFNALKKINSELMTVMKDHKMVLLSSTKTRQIYGVYDEFVISKITQGGVRIIPHGLVPESITSMYYKLSQNKY